MMNHDITTQAGARRRRKRVGRGQSSGLGKTGGRGNKGMQSRAGHGPHPLHEGGAFPLFRRTPKRGFNNFNFRVEYDVVNLDTLAESFENGAKVDAEALKARGLLGGTRPIKILGRGALDKKLNVHADAASASAKSAIEKAGGSLTLAQRSDAAALAKAKRNSAKGKPRPKPAP
ncbi:MAG: 50S ribosomal protein L15 [Phycisphaerae bacterium]